MDAVGIEVKEGAVKHREPVKSCTMEKIRKLKVELIAHSSFLFLKHWVNIPIRGKIKYKETTHAKRYCLL
jgi:hypothetical protein